MGSPPSLSDSRLSYVCILCAYDVNAFLRIRILALFLYAGGGV